VHSIFSFAKVVLDFVGQVIPFYVEAKLATLVYLAFMGGATKVYNIALHPLLKQHEATIDAQLQRAESTGKQKLREVKRLLSKEHGQ
jgi:hypothetical protein